MGFEDDIKIGAIIFFVGLFLGLFFGIIIGYYYWASFLNWFYSGLAEAETIAFIVILVIFVIAIIAIVIDYMRKH